MEKRRISHIVLAVLSVAAAMVLFVTYGTVLPSAPFVAVPLNGPTTADSDGEFTVVADTESRRALILNADGDLTGVVSCVTADSPVDAITDVCVRDGRIYVLGVRYEPDSDTITKERVAVYDKGGNLQDVVYEKAGRDENRLIKALHDTREGVAVSYEQYSVDQPDAVKGDIVFDLIGEDGITQIGQVKKGSTGVFDVALADDDNGEYRYVTLSVRGMLGDGESEFDQKVLAGHVYTAIALDSKGTLYACDDETGALCAIPSGANDVKVLVEGSGYHSVHENKGVISLCNTEANQLKLCDTSGVVQDEFTEVKPSIGFSARMLVVWASGLYLAALALILIVRKTRRLVKEGKTEGIGTMFTAVAIVTAVAVAVGSLSFASYQKMYDLRSSEIRMCADHLDNLSFTMSEAMEKVKDRDALHGTNEEELTAAVLNLFEAASPALSLVSSANNNGIGLYCSLYGKDDKGVYYLYGSTDDYVMGTSARGAASNGIQEAFEIGAATNGRLLRGTTLRDATQYQLVQIPTTDRKGVAGVIEIGSKVRSFESSVVGDLAQRILTLLVLVLVVYLAYSELRACGRCLFSYRQRQPADGNRAIALLTRPFTLAVTMLTSIDSVMTVLIARDLLTKAGMGESSPLLAVPAVMLGIGMVVGQGVYAVLGSKVGLRKLIIIGAFAMLACACATGAAVHSGDFRLYCIAKLAMAIPFGMLYTLGYSLPRLAGDDETRAVAAGGVRRTDTSAAALGTVLGGYAAQTLGDVWVYALVAVACLPIILMALNLLPKGVAPLEKLAQPTAETGRISSFLKKPQALAMAFLVVLPATVAAGYASFLFPLFSSDLGLLKSDVNNIVVLGQLVVYVLIDAIDRMESRHGRWRVSTAAIALLGLTFLLFALNTTLVWSIAVIAIVAVLCKSADGWKRMWLATAREAGVPAGRATSAMFATRSLALVAQPFILSALLGATNAVAVIVIGLICAACAGLFFLTTRRTSLAK